MRRKTYPNVDAALPTYHAINAAKGLPRKGVCFGKGRNVDQPDIPTDENYIGWTVQACYLVDGPGPTVSIVFDDQILELDGTQPAGQIEINLTGHVPHDPQLEHPSGPLANDALYIQIRPRMPR